MNVVFYDAGAVMEVAGVATEFEVVGVVDDDPWKHSSQRRPVRPRASFGDLAPDAVVITTFRHADGIRNRVSPLLLPPCA